ncbi:MAG: hypothetical protein R2800_09575 [Flavipsychrobacter sp.]
MEKVSCSNKECKLDVVFQKEIPSTNVLPGIEYDIPQVPSRAISASIAEERDETKSEVEYRHYIVVYCDNGHANYIGYNLPSTK